MHTICAKLAAMFFFFATAAVFALIIIAVALWVGLGGMKISGAAWYGEIKSWRLGLGACAGLIAIIAGAMVNANLVRERDDRLRYLDKIELVDALRGEVGVAIYRLGYVSKRVKVLREQQIVEVWDFESLAIPRYTIYEASVDRIGELGNLTDEIIDFYEALESLRSTVKARVRAAIVSEQVDPAMLVFTGRDVDIFLLMVGSGERLIEKLKTFADGLDEP